jgi:hypothetical protein
MCPHTAVYLDADATTSADADTTVSVMCPHTAVYLDADATVSATSRTRTSRCVVHVLLKNSTSAP